MKMNEFRIALTLICLLLLSSGTSYSAELTQLGLAENVPWFFLQPDDLNAGQHHTRHAEIFGKYVNETYNFAVLEGIDKVQASTNQGGGYFIGIKAVPTESPVGYPLKLFGLSLLDPPRTTSYCSGSTYAAFIETLNLILPDGAERLNLQRFEAMRMQEPDGGRREDEIKFWGHWNDDGFGSHFALVQYSGMGIEVPPRSARPGDFMNISWTHGGGHSVVFLGWIKDENGEIGIAYWSSQPSTNGFGDIYSKSIKKISNVKIVRLASPDKVFFFDFNQAVDRKIPGDKINPSASSQ